MKVYFLETGYGDEPPRIWLDGNKALAYVAAKVQEARAKNLFVLTWPGGARIGDASYYNVLEVETED